MGRRPTGRDPGRPRKWTRAWTTGVALPADVGTYAAQLPDREERHAYLVRTARDRRLNGFCHFCERVFGVPGGALLCRECTYSLSVLVRAGEDLDCCDCQGVSIALENVVSQCRLTFS